MFQIEQMITRLSSYYWSPLHPSKYTVTGANGLPAGIGLLAHECPAAFNVVWAIQPLVTFKDHQSAVMSWSQLSRQFDVKVGEEYLDYAITSRTRAGFKQWYAAHKPNIKIQTRYFLDKV